MDDKEISLNNLSIIQKAENNKYVDVNAQRIVKQPEEEFIPTPYDSIRKAITQKKFIEMGRSIENVD